MLKPKALDAQSEIKIDEWIDIESEKCKKLDDNMDLTKKILKMGFEGEPFLFLDDLGRIWGHDPVNNVYYPYHFNVGNKHYGYRMPRKAAN
jgi:hypothetical protein